jgi:hypothetical protein
MVKAVILRPTEDGLAYYVHLEDGTAVPVPVSLDTAAENIRLLAEFLASEIDDLRLAGFRAEEAFAFIAARKVCECEPPAPLHEKIVDPEVVAAAALIRPGLEEDETE